MDKDKNINCFTTVLEMFDQRGYIFLEKDDERIIACKENGNLICAFIPLITSKFNVEKFQFVLSLAKQMEIKHILMVYKENVTSQAKKLIEASISDLKIELFEEAELQFNLTKHKLVPNHILYAKKDSNSAKEFKLKYNENNLPVILKTDPVSRFYLFEKGDLIKIERNDGLVIFRIVK